MSPESLAMLQKHDLLAKCVSSLALEQQIRIHFNALEGSYALCLTANLVHLAALATEEDFAKVSGRPL